MDLKPCPFCAGEASLWRNVGRYGLFGYVQCDVCGARTKPQKIEHMREFESEESFWNQPGYKAAGNAWNTRKKRKKEATNGASV